jgi:hypothetical protein
MPDLDQIKQAEQVARDWRGRFSKGRSGDPAGPRCSSLSWLYLMKTRAAAASLMDASSPYPDRWYRRMQGW